MPENHPFPQAVNDARTMQAALSLGRRLDLWSLLLALLALASLFNLPMTGLQRIGLLISLLTAGVQKYFALRTAFDEKLFCNLARQWAGKTPAEDASTLTELARLDQSLAQCLQCPPKDDKVRDLSSRLHGASCLIKRQTAAFFLQFASMLAAAAATGLPLAG